MSTSIKEQTQIPKGFNSTKYPIFLGIISIIIVLIIVIYASLHDKSDEANLDDLQSKIDKGIPLLDYEKKSYCDLLYKVKKIRLCACKKNYINRIGSLTGYDVKESDLDWRGSGKTFD